MNTLQKTFKFISKPKENYPNFYIFSYHCLKAGQKLFTRLGFTGKSRNKNDMFNWRLYNLHYKGEVKELKKTLTLTLKKGDYIFDGQKLTKADPAIKPLHPNWQLLYETILQLNPASAFEMGAGNGMHLHNLQTLKPDLILSGIDLSAEQISFLRRTYPNLKAAINQADATLPFNSNIKPADLSYTQAVIMHIHTGEAHLNALTNLFNNSTKHVILVERWKNHPFLKDIKKLQQTGAIKWPHINFYYRQSTDDPAVFIMICSKDNLPYPVLEDYNILPQN